MALQGAAERPLFGWGQEGFNYVFNTYYRPELVTQEPWFDRAHNVVLDWLIAGGIVGMLLYLSLYAVLLYYLWRPQSGFDVSERAILTGLIAAYSFHNLFVFDNLLSYVLFMMLFSYITVRAQSTRPASEGKEILAPEMATPISIVGLIVVLLAVNWSGYASATGVIQGLSPQPEGLTKNLQYFTEAARRTGHGYQEVGEQFLQFAMQVRGLNVGDEAFQAHTMQEARTAFDGVLAQAPKDSRLLVFYGSFLRQMGDAEGARTYATKALELSPKKQSIKLELGILEIAQRRFDAGLPLLKEVYDAAPRYGNVHVYYSAALILAGRVEDSQKVLMESFNTLEPLDATIASAYLQANKYAQAKAIALKLTEANPSPDTFKFLGGVLIKGGEAEAAILALERVKQLDPRLAPEVDAYITQLRTEGK